MSLRSPKEHENGWHSQNTLLFSIRHSRARGNPGSFCAELAWIPAFAGMTSRGGSSLCRSSPHRYFRRRRRVERRRVTVQVSDFHCIRPFELRGKWPPDHQHVSSPLSKIPYSGFSPVRLQTGFLPRPSSTMPSLSARPAFPPARWLYTWLQSLSPGRASAAVLGLASNRISLAPAGDYPVQRSLAPQRVMLSRRIIAYYSPIRASRPLPPVYELSSGSLPYGLVYRFIETYLLAMPSVILTTWLENRLVPN